MKRQKTLPKTLNKNEYILELKEVIKELKEQQRRAKVSLERAMCEETVFGAEEIEKILGNPVLAPLVKNLVWTNGETSGFLGETDGLQEGELKVAHPHDMKTEGTWSAYMHLLYERKVKQPFKQEK